MYSGVRGKGAPLVVGPAARNRRIRCGIIGSRLIQSVTAACLCLPKAVGLSVIGSLDWFDERKGFAQCAWFGCPREAPVTVTDAA